VTIENVVAVADGGSPVVAALRLAGWRVRLRDVSQPLDTLTVLSPDAVVIDVTDATLGTTLELVRGGANMDAVPVLAAVDADTLRDATVLRAVTDFCVRPCGGAELAARLRRMVKRAAANLNGHRLVAGPLTIDLKSFEATLDGLALDLAYQEFQLLRFLVQHPSQAFSREQLLARVWGWDYYGGSRTVDIHVRRIRAKLGHPLVGWLQTVRHVGYRWSPDGASDGDAASDVAG